MWILTAIRLYSKKLWNKFFGRMEITPKGQRAKEYFSKIILDPNTQPITYEEMLFEDALTEIMQNLNINREQAAAQLWELLFTSM